jgi:hypothetical protein
LEKYIEGANVSMAKDQVAVIVVYLDTVTTTRITANYKLDSSADNCISCVSSSSFWNNKTLCSPSAEQDTVSTVSQCVNELKELPTAQREVMINDTLEWTPFVGSA